MITLILHYFQVDVLLMYLEECNVFRAPFYRITVRQPTPFGAMFCFAACYDQFVTVAVFLRWEAVQCLQLNHDWV